MKPIGKDEVLPFQEWERVRARLRPLFMNEKERRRLAIGPHLTLLFENAQTVWYQIQEMLRAEKISDPDAIQHELDTYNELIPGAHELSATLLIEFPDRHEREVALKRLVGLERHLSLRAGETRLRAAFDPRQMDAEEVSAVQFVRFPLEQLGADRILELAGEGMLVVEVDHPYLSTKAQITGPLTKALAEDLRAEMSGQ